MFSIAIPTWMRKPHLALLALLLLGLLLRSAGLGHSPPGLNSDELLKVFDGASVWQTGQDHHGASWPLFFRQSGEYSPPIYIYFAGLFSALFGVNPYTARVPSALLGVLSIALTYALMRRWRGETAGLIAAALVCLSPWNLHYSRVGWEAISLIPLQLGGLLAFYVWLEKGRWKHAVLSALCFAATLYAYPTARLSTPLFLLALLFLYRREIVMQWRSAVAGVGALGLLSAPLAYSLWVHSEAMQARWQFVSIFNQPNPAQLFVQHYFMHLSPGFLFVSGDANPLHNLTGGVVLAALAPFVLWGLVAIFLERRREQWLLLLWLLIFAIPASLTYDRFQPNSMPNALRSAGGMPLFELLATLGVTDLLRRIPRPAWRTAAASLIAVMVVINASWLVWDAFARYPQRSAEAWQAGLQTAVHELDSRKHDYERVVISHRVRLHPVALAVFAGREPGPFDGSSFPKYILPFPHYVPIYRDFGHEQYFFFSGQEMGSIARWYHLGPSGTLLLAKADEVDGVEPLRVIEDGFGSPAYFILAK
mgnify:CR=1 FL=1